MRGRAGPNSNWYHEHHREYPLGPTRRLLRVALVMTVLWATAQAQTQPPTYTISDLGTLPGGSYSVGRAINPAGLVVGRADDAGGNGRAFSWLSGVITDLGTLPGGTYAEAWAVNASGQIAGEADDSSGLSHPVIWQDGVMTDIGIPAGVNVAHAQGINVSGQVVGYGDGGVQRAFPWHGGVLTDLNTLIPSDSGWVLYSASAINDAGQIIGEGAVNGQPHAFLLTPQAQTPTQAISEVISQVETLGLDGGSQASLTTKLRSAQGAFARGNSRAAAKNPHAFINETRALERSDRSAPSTADALIGTVEQITGVLD